MLSCDIVRPALQAPPNYCHLFLTMFNTPGAMAVAVAAQRQAVGFFRNGEKCKIGDPCIPDVNNMVRPIFGRDVFETGQPLPENLGFQ